jgi:hypothetical protein
MGVGQPSRHGTPNVSRLRSLVKRTRALRTPLFLAQNAHVALISLLPNRAAKPAGSSWVYYLSATVRIKNEARFLPEWIAHHLNVGIEHFFIYDNGSTDATRESIDPFIAQGLVTYVSWPTIPVSPSCYLDFFARFGSESKWVAFFDADEFLIELVPGATVEVLKANEDRPAVAVNWRYFGSSGHEVVPSGLVTEQFIWADAACDEHVKVIAQPAEVYRYRNPHNFYYRYGRLGVTPSGRRAFGSFAAPCDESILVLHHYVCRSRQDYERKVRRGFAEERGRKDQERQDSRSATEFCRHNEVNVGVPEETLRATAEVLRESGFPSSLYHAS